MYLTLHDAALSFHVEPVPTGFRECLEQQRGLTNRPDHIYAATILGEITAAQHNFAEDVPPDLPEESALAACIEAVWGPGVPTTVVNTACTSGATALVCAACHLKARPADTLLVIAYEEMSLFHSSGFSALRVLDRETRPFAKDRQGFHLAPAIAMARLSRKDASVRLSAFAISNDAHHPTGPHRTGDGIRQCIESCLQQRHLRPEDIDAIKLNGTGTPYSDEAEYKALSAVFGDRLPSIPAFFFKAKLGHLQGAGGLVESLMTLQALQLNLVPAIPAPVAEQLDFPLNLSSEPREMERRNCLLVYSGIGGHNVCLLMEKRPAMAEIPHG